MKKVILITNIPNPYRVPLFNELSSQLQEKGMTLKVIFASSGYERRYFKLDPTDFKFDYQILEGGIHTSSSNIEKTYFLYQGINKLLNQEKPWRIIVAGFSPATVRVFFRKLFHRTPYIIWSGSIEKENRNSGVLRKLQRKILAQNAAGFIAYGSLAKKYLMNAGIPEDKISIGINTVDTSFFSTTTDLERKNRPKNTALTIFTYLGYLVPRKNVLCLLEAIQLLSQKRKDFRLDIIGDGDSKSSLENFVLQNNLQDQVNFLGFKQKDELPQYFAQSTALLFQTDFDIWGLVLNEAMAAGLPCIASIHAGASYDLIRENENGFVMDFSHIHEVAEKMNWIIDHPQEMKRMGEKAASYIEAHASLKISAAGFIKALEKTS
ncbi:hypothetical protein BH11BAC2_BH11BAC2_07300 [soil metagenome]